MTLLNCVRESHTKSAHLAGLLVSQFTTSLSVNCSNDEEIDNLVKAIRTDFPEYTMTEEPRFRKLLRELLISEAEALRAAKL